MTKLLCQINDEAFFTKPTDLRFMGKLRDKMVQKQWSYITEDEFISKVTSGYAWYGCLFNGHDLMHCDTQSQRQCWRAQTIIAVDIDKCAVPAQRMAHFYTDLGYMPWLVYRTFSDGKDGLHSYRLMWQVEVDHRISYEMWAAVIKGLSGLTEYGDKRACDGTRMWQGGHHAPSWHVSQKPWSYSEFASKLGLL